MSVYRGDRTQNIIFENIVDEIPPGTYRRGTAAVLNGTPRREVKNAP